MTNYNEFCNEEAQVTEEGFLKKHKELIVDSVIAGLICAAGCSIGYYAGKKWCINKLLSMEVEQYPVLKTDRLTGKPIIRTALFEFDKKNNLEVSVPAHVARDLAKVYSEIADEIEQVTE